MTTWMGLSHMIKIRRTSVERVNKMCSASSEGKSYYNSEHKCTAISLTFGLRLPNVAVFPTNISYNFDQG